MTNRIVVVAVFLMGCAVGGVSSQLMVPKANAQQAATLTRWEFRCITRDPEDIATVASAFGDQSWDMAGLTGSPSGDVVACFKRPKM
jgi:hypothetical protein